MTQAERDVLGWLLVDQRPLVRLLAMSCDQADAWIREHDGNFRHIDALCGIRDQLAASQAGRIRGFANVVSLRA
jgi:hypothetical protein